MALHRAAVDMTGTRRPPLAAAPSPMAGRRTKRSGPMHHRPNLGIIFLAALFTFAAGCTAADDARSSPAPAVGATPAAAQATQWDVQVGGNIAAESIQVNAFLPRELTVAAGDMVRFSFHAAFHTVTFAAGTSPLTPADDFVPGPGAGELTLGPALFPFPPGPSVETATFTGAPLSSGIPPDDPEAFVFTVTFSQSGVLSYICLVHGNLMQGTITVLAPGVAVPEAPMQAAARGQAEQAELVSTIRRVQQRSRPATRAAPEGTTVHAVSAGVGDRSGVSAEQFLPDTLTVRRGDLVDWSTTDPLEIHTVSFTSGAPPPPFLDPRPGPGGAPLLVVPANVAGRTGEAIYAGHGYVNSGILFPGRSFRLQIDAPPGRYAYLCLIHGTESGGMRATLIVTE
jgi:plastocyanin